MQIVRSLVHSLIQSFTSVSQSVIQCFSHALAQSVRGQFHLFPRLAQVALWPLEWLCPLERRPHEAWSTTGGDSGCDLAELAPKLISFEFEFEFEFNFYLFVHKLPRIVRIGSALLILVPCPGMLRQVAGCK